MNEIALNLAEQINQTYEESLALASSVKAGASEAIEKALECGRLMTQQKETLQKASGKERCGWLEWLQENCPQISEWKARRYMKLANRAHVPDYFENVTTLRQAYIATGVLPLPDKKPKVPDAQTPWVKFTRFLDGFRLWFNKRVADEPLEDWQEDARRVLKNELLWFAELYERL